MYNYRYYYLHNPAEGRDSANIYNIFGIPNMRNSVNINNHFKGNVPSIYTRPRWANYNLPNSAEEKIDSILQKNKIFHILISLLGSLLIEAVWLTGFDWSMALIMFFLSSLPAGLLIYIFTSSFFEERVLFDNDGYYKRYLQYINDLKSYYYWTSLTELNFWMSLSGHEFEDAVAAVYRKKGYRALVSKHGGDGGIDIILDNGREKIAVQCKALKNKVQPAVARDLYGTMIANGYQKGIIASRSGFTSGVREFVLGKNIDLVDLDTILSMANS